MSGPVIGSSDDEGELRVPQTRSRELFRPRTEGEPADLRRKTARGALAALGGQGANFVLRMGSMVVIARLVTPEQFGLMGMVTAFTGLLNLLQDGGLPQATVQRADLTEELASTLFWLNLALGAGLAVVIAMAAPLVVYFYGDPRLLWMTVALGGAFVLNGASAQHRALLQRSMRLASLVAIDIISLVASIVIGVWMAIDGFGYWALVGMTLAQPAGAMLGAWVATGWLPGLPQRRTGARSMLRYGGVLTVNLFVVYIAYNVDKVLLGRFWGAEVLGLYGRAYQLINIPNANLNSAMGYVMFPALARVQNDPARQRSYFLKSYGLFLSVVMPTTIACALFASDIVRVLLGPQWMAAVPIFRFLAPTILAFALINPLGYVLQSSGRVVRSLNMAFLIAPIVILGYSLGLPQGPEGVAFGYSAAMVLLVAPCVLWAKHGTLITAADLLRTSLPPFVSAVAGALVAMGVWSLLPDANALLRLVAVSAVLFSVHTLTLLFGLGQKEVYMDMVRAIGLSRRRDAAQ